MEETIKQATEEFVKRIREERAAAVEDALLLVIEKISEHARGLKRIRVDDVVDIIDSIIDEQLEEKNNEQ